MIVTANTGGYGTDTTVPMDNFITDNATISTSGPHEIHATAVIRERDKKDDLQKRQESDFQLALAKPKRNFYRRTFVRRDFDPMRLNRRRQLRVPLNQQRPRDGLK